MQKLIIEIFDKVNINIPDLPETEQTIAKQVEAILADMEEQMPQEFHDEIGRRFLKCQASQSAKDLSWG